MKTLYSIVLPKGGLGGTGAQKRELRWQRTREEMWMLRKGGSVNQEKYKHRPDEENATPCHPLGAESGKLRGRYVHSTYLLVMLQGAGIAGVAWKVLI